MTGRSVVRSGFPLVMRIVALRSEFRVNRFPPKAQSPGSSTDPSLASLCPVSIHRSLDLTVSIARSVAFKNSKSSARVCSCPSILLTGPRYAGSCGVSGVASFVSRSDCGLTDTVPD